MEDLKGRIALVTGSGQGIGEAIATELAACGAIVAVLDIHSEAVKRVAGKLAGVAGDALAIQADVGVVDDVQNAVDQILQRFGQIDILVNNVGISPKDGKGDRIPTLALDPAEWDRVMNINLKSVFICTQLVGREMKKRSTGSILNISSISAKIGNSGPPAAHYCASKAGINNFTIYTAKEFVPYGIRVNAIAPGTVQTAQRAGTSAAYNELLLKQIPMARFAQPSEIAKAAAFLVSDSASYITGEILDVNGGAYMD
jgi:3-oxoacyl-[acyl-carrier protein] reductase